MGDENEYMYVCECFTFGCGARLSITEDDYRNLITIYGIFGFRIYHIECDAGLKRAYSEEMILLTVRDNYKIYIVPSDEYSKTFASDVVAMFNFWR